MKEENKRLSKKIEELFEEKTIFEKKIYKIQQSFEDRMTSDREIIEKSDQTIFFFENKILEKNITIDQLKLELQKYYNNDNKWKYRLIFVTDPNSANVDLNNELNYTRDLLVKISKLMNSEQSESENLKIQIKCLKDRLNLCRISNKGFQAISKNVLIGKNIFYCQNRLII